MQLETLFLVVNRAQTAEAYANIPVEDQPSEEMLRDYGYGNYPHLSNPAWGKYFPQLCAWINDYEVKKRRKANKPTDGIPSFDNGGFNITSENAWGDE